MNTMVGHRQNLKSYTYISRMDVCTVYTRTLTPAAILRERERGGGGGGGE